MQLGASLSMLKWIGIYVRIVHLSLILLTSIPTIVCPDRPKPAILRYWKL